MERGFFCCSLLRPYSLLDSTAPVERSLASSASSASIRFRAPFAVLRNRAFSLDSNVIVAFWRRDRRRILRNSASMADSDVESVFLTVRSLASRSCDAAQAAFAAFTDLRSRAFSLRSRTIVVFWRRDLRSTLRR